MYSVSSIQKSALLREEITKHKYVDLSSVTFVDTDINFSQATVHNPTNIVSSDYNSVSAGIASTSIAVPASNKVKFYSLGAFLTKPPTNLDGKNSFFYRISGAFHCVADSDLTGISVIGLLGSCATFPTVDTSASDVYYNIVPLTVDRNNRSVLATIDTQVAHFSFAVERPVCFGFAIVSRNTAVISGFGFKADMRIWRWYDDLDVYEHRR